ncbi:MAG: DNA repair protein RecN, partial [Gemmatimonadetes bacterium]|nr:DNA repair protein RecN [Gemmatimonadota bacterium]NIR80057.1 DNA repair protein RecN [Gemmatimonadota bacterium]NIT88795.1 DNA repair protein RecN [Gemmatimonadota bacterium]NIU32599.1 DNA repair protein RecN [Gemmatimonadota bacterium]NIU37054.1 DNA repair protein RecN [Gemmatimonadota bacterium]
IDASEGLLILKREVAREGRNRAWVNGSPATATMVGELGTALVDLHGQHEHQTLLRPAEQREILDAFAGAREPARRVRELHGRWSELRDERERREERRRELESRADFLRFQLSEIEDASLEPGEDASLEEEANRLEHSEELMREATRIHEGLYAGEGSVSDLLAELRDALRCIARIDASLDEVLERLEDAYHTVVDAGRRMGDYAADVDHDPRRLERIRERQDLLFRLKRKYGPELEDVIETGRRVRAELDELEGAAVDLEALDREIEEARAALRDEAEFLSEARGEAAERLASEVQALLPDLGMPGSVFQVALVGREEPGPGGFESVEFRASLNPGFEPRALKRIASGGELSRVMLALKAILARVDRVPTLVFDEIDAGIGGVVAGRVAEKLRDVAEHHQVFVITHLPQLASRAHQHFNVEKGEEGGVATTRVVELAGEERVREIARMLGGDPESSASRDHARELLHAV